LHRLLGAVLYALGDLERAQATLAQGLQVAAAAGLPAVQARIQVLRAEIQANESGFFVEAIEPCEAAAAVLESEGDLEGLAEALVSVGKMRFWGGDTLAASSPAARRRLRPAKRQPPRGAEVHNPPGGYLVGPAHPV
jgi:hypothetical protein